MSSGMVGESRTTRAIRSMCGFLHKRAAAVVVTSNGMKEHLVRQGLGADKVHIVHQWADEVALAPVERCPEFGAAHGLDGKFNVVFTGNVGAAQGVDTILGAALQLRHFDKIQFVIVGAGLELDSLREKAAAMRLENVKFVGHVAKEHVPSFLAWAAGLLVTLKDDPLFAITVPSKTQAYMLAGRPILCGVAGDTADIVDRTRSGLCFAPEDKYALADAVLDLFSIGDAERAQLGANARAAYDAEFSVARSVERYEKLFTGVLDPQYSESPTGLQRAA
jgi:glycosyltransferase involved in cell wall biosynthesis